MISEKVVEVAAAKIFCHAQFKGDDYTARFLARDILAAVLSLQDHAAGLSEDAVLDLMREHLSSGVIKAMTVTVWKDGIDIQRPTYPTMEFVRAARASPVPIAEDGTKS